MHIRPLLDCKQMLFYARYMDDILIIRDTEYTNQDTMAQYINPINENLHI